MCYNDCTENLVIDNGGIRVFLSLSLCVQPLSVSHTESGRTALPFPLESTNKRVRLPPLSQTFPTQITDATMRTMMLQLQ